MSNRFDAFAENRCLDTRPESFTVGGVQRCINCTLLALMRNNGISEEELAHRMYLSKPQVRLRLKCRVPWSVFEVVSLAEMFNIPVHALLPALVRG